MYGSFVVKFKNIGEDLNIATPSLYFRELLSEKAGLGEEEYKVNVLRNPVSSCTIEGGEFFYLRVCYFREEGFLAASQELFKYMLLKLPLGQFEICRFNSGGKSNLWSKTYDAIKMGDRFILDFYTPLFIKFGDRFITEFDIYLLLKQLYRENKSLGKIDLKEIASKIKVNILRPRVSKVFFEKKFALGFSGEAEINLELLNYYEKESVKTLIKKGYFYGAGYRKEWGCGMYSVKNPITDNAAEVEE
ncbi:CRISPR system precrRNA processing endoribonuclease RAMP protein Cas6 [uncultured Ilyobacter sp.]|uniref:CRISPR system precrRNA processing endoribonuclease RAMP protein Cas6 n=1 Tax=uncultured Ilyobacter sp. TaxID=544433 RepID=UPI0029C7470C|nr:CRISPR system precrRNA processing endoribonuclease RAMP protein Cas6 [uncultured Ilyobacter sp.]